MKNLFVNGVNHISIDAIYMHSGLRQFPQLRPLPELKISWCIMVKGQNESLTSTSFSFYGYFMTA